MPLGVRKWGVWDGDNRSSWCLIFPTLSIGTGARGTPPRSRPLHPGFWGSGKGLPDPTVWVFITTPKRRGQGRGWELFWVWKEDCGRRERDAMTGLAGLGPLRLAPFHPHHPAQRTVTPQSDLSIDDAEAEGEVEGGGEKPRQGLGWGEEMSTQGLGSHQMVRWLQRRGREDTALWAAMARSSWGPPQDTLCGCCHGP